MRFVKIDDIPKEPPTVATELLAIALEDLAMVKALELIHGHERALELYVERGGRVRFNEDGEPGVLAD